MSVPTIEIAPKKGVQTKTFVKNPLTGKFELVQSFWEKNKTPVMVAGAVAVVGVLLFMRKRKKR